MTNKYLELLGSVEFNTYMQTVLNKNLGLQNNASFQALLVDLMVNSVDFNSQGKTRAIALEKFVFLLLQLENPSFYQQFADVKKMYQRDLETNYSPNIAAALVEDADFLLTYSLVSMAKNLNFFGQLDVYMKELARITLSLKKVAPGLSQRFEELLSREIAVSTGKSSYYQPLSDKDYAPHHNVLA